MTLRPSPRLSSATLSPMFIFSAPDFAQGLLRRTLRWEEFGLAPHQDFVEGRRRETVVIFALLASLIPLAKTTYAVSYPQSIAVILIHFRCLPPDSTEKERYYWAKLPVLSIKMWEEVQLWRINFQELSIWVLWESKRRMRRTQASSDHYDIRFCCETHRRLFLVLYI